MSVAIIDGLFGEGGGCRLIGIPELVNPPLVTLPCFRSALESGRRILLAGEILGLGSVHLEEGKRHRGHALGTLDFDLDEVDIIVL